MKKHFIFLFFCLPLLLAQAQKVEVGVESQEVWLNTPFIYQIRVSADEEVAAPMLPPFPGFTVAPQEPQRQRSSQISIINGRHTQTTTVTTTFNYLLTAQRLGTLTIPSVEVNVLGAVKNTQPIQIAVRPAEKIDGITLRLEASSQECYVGEPIMLTWRWQIDRKIYQYAFNLPLLSMPDFSFPDYLPQIDQRRQRQYQRISNHQNAELIAVQSNARLKDKTVTVLTFEKPFIPLKPGNYRLPESTVLCEIEDPRAARQPNRRRSPFDDFDGFFGSRTQTRKISVSAPPVSISVKALPSENQPENFSGIVGDCKISASAEPLEVNVGDPIILTINLAGPRFLDHLKLPPLDTLPALSGQFKVSGEEPGQVQKGVKVFQRTLRANHHQISEIPALEIPFFNSQKGVYDFARSAPIPIKVAPVRQVTLQDAQGVTTTADSPASRELQTSDAGIAHNYDAAAILSARNHDPRLWLASPTTRTLLLLPPGFWFAASLGSVCLRRRQANSGAWAARKAAAQCRKRLQKIKAGSPESVDLIFDILQEYLTTRFQLQPGVVTYADLSKLLQSRNIDQAACLPFKEIFAACEASRFAGAGSQSAAEIRAAALAALRKLERVL
jgi:hypothetical protein